MTHFIIAAHGSRSPLAFLVDEGAWIGVASTMVPVAILMRLASKCDGVAVPSSAGESRSGRVSASAHREVAPLQPANSHKMQPNTALPAQLQLLPSANQCLSQSFLIARRSEWRTRTVRRAGSRLLPFPCLLLVDRPAPVNDGRRCCEDPLRMPFAGTLRP